MENLGYLFAAFTVIWAMVFGYILVLMNRQKKLKRDIEKLETDNR
ncbi:CcmD family protein [Chloroflexota bacterium]